MASASNPLPTATDRPALRSDLARFCLPSAARDDSRKFAWTAAVSALFLGIGIIGLFARPLPVIRPPAPPDEIIPIAFDPPPAPAVLETPQVTDPNDSPKEILEASQPVVIAAANPAQVAFAVPVTGVTLVAPAKMATAPPAQLVAPRPAPAAVTAPQPALFTGGGTSGDYPNPDYPRDAIRRHLQGRLLLLVLVGRNGLVEKADVRESSGHALLDRHAADFVQRRWVWPVGEARQFLVPVNFVLN